LCSLEKLEIGRSAGSGTNFRTNWHATLIGSFREIEPHDMNLHVQIDPNRLAVIGECMNNYNVGDADAEWPNTIMSRRAVVYSDGTIARSADSVSHAVDAAELALCERLSDEVAQLMAGISVGMGSESDDVFRNFFIVALPGSAKPSVIDEALIRERFGGTLFPLVTITVEPFAENTVWWEEVALDGVESEASYFMPWQAMSAWFRQQSAFTATAFVRIGDKRELSGLPKASWPRGTVITGCVVPRLALGLTPNGSLAGLFGHVVQT
jgi:hypothetical protein